MRHVRSRPPTFESGDRDDSPRVLANLRLKLVTPMFGGGVTPGDVDPDQPIRPSAIRGHLRFWWRACNAAAYGSIEELARAERLLWGSMAKRVKDDADPDFGTYGPGALSIHVTVETRGTDQPYDTGNPPYVVWPFAPQNDGRTLAKEGRSGLVFDLKVALAPYAARHEEPTSRPGVSEAACRLAAEQSLWAWITFGGVGARTRRGCGSLVCEQNALEGAVLDASVFQVQGQPKAWLASRLRELVPDGDAIANVPTLVGSSILLGRQPAAPGSAWSAAIRPLRDFLQEENIGRNERPDPDDDIRFPDNTPGQSRWPEASAFRRILNRGHMNDVSGHPYKVQTAATARGNQFPRADLGLPRAIKTYTDDNPPAVLEAAGEGQTRMASPIILKPLAGVNGSAYAMAVQLTAPHPWSEGAPGLRIAERKDGPYHRVASLPPSEQPPAWPFPDHIPPQMDGAESARHGFMSYVKSKTNAWDEVQR